MKVDRRGYKWKAFKMKWLVPNWERAVGPAFWAYKLWYNTNWWWHREMDPDIYGNLRWKANDFFKNKLVKWFTPHLRNARDFMAFCIELNGTKLLDWDSMSFYIRTRDGNQYYFLGKVNWLGRVRVWKRQWIDGRGEAQNLFMFGVVHGLCGKEMKEDDVPVLHEELVFDGVVLTRGQLVRAMREVLMCREFDWGEGYAAMHVLATEMGVENEYDFTNQLLSSVMSEIFGVETDASAYWNLNEEGQGKVDAAVACMTVDEARRRIGKQQERNGNVRQ